jgi:hypothetical protein
MEQRRVGEVFHTEIKFQLRTEWKLVCIKERRGKKSTFQAKIDKSP